MLVYFDTSAINRLAKDRSIEDAIATKELQREKGRRWLISIISLWEIFLTKNEEKRAWLINFSRFLFDDNLIASPEEIIVNFVNAGCPVYERKYPLISQGLMAKEWLEACRNKEYLFHPSKQDLKFRTYVWRMYGKFIDGIIRNKSIITSKEIPRDLNEVFINEIYESLDWVNENKYIDKETESVIRIAIFYSMIIFCWGILFDQITVEQFWKKKGIEEPRDRVRFLARNFPELFYRGPIAGMARMTYQQCKSKYTRGAFFDALHSLYIDYVHRFITADEHFKKLRKDGYDPNYMKIYHIEELQWTEHIRDVSGKY